MKYQPYPEYKDSGVEWIGEIPEGWETPPLKRRVTFIAGIGFPPDEQGASGNELPFYKVKDLGNERLSGIIGETEHSISRSTAEKLRAKIIPPSTIVFAKVGMAIPLNRFCFTDIDCCIDNNMMGAISIGIERGFLRYLFPILRIPDHMNPGAVPSLSEDIVGQIVIPFPPITTQRAIAAFLDAETTRIDGLVRDFEELISLLQEKRQALISRAVTRGLSELVSPDDPEFGEWAKPVAFKESGVEWIGEIPEGWVYSKLKYGLLLNDGGAWGTDPLEDGSDHIVLRSTEQMADGSWNIVDPAFRSLSGREFDSTKLVYGDLLITKSSGSSFHIGKASMVTKEIEELSCSFSNFMQRLRVQANILPKYCWYILNNNIAREQFNYLSNSTTGLSNLSKTVFNDLLVPVPPLPTQRAIAAFLDRETGKMDELIVEARSAIELLKERRAALITDAVTGKINVEASA